MLTTMLRSIKDLYGFSVRTTDVVVGIVREFYLNDEKWTIQSFDVRSGSDLEPRDIRLQIELLEEVDPEQRALFIQLSDDEIRRRLLVTRARDTSEDLRPVRRLMDFQVNAQDGPVGKVEDLIVNDADLAVRYLTVTADSNGKKYILSPWWIKAVRWQKNEIFLHFKIEQVLRSPVYDFQVPVSRDYETQLHEYYDKQTYWV